MMLGSTRLPLQLLVWHWFLPLATSTLILGNVWQYHSWYPSELLSSREEDFQVSVQDRIPCIAFAASSNSSNIVCFEEESKECRGYSSSIFDKEKDRNEDNGWQCYYTGPQCRHPFIPVAGVGCIHIPQQETIFADADTVCPLDSQMFGPDSLDQFEALRLELVNLKESGVISHTDLYIAIYKNSSTWINSKTGVALMTHPSSKGVYPFGKNDPDGDTPCARLFYNTKINSYFLWADKSCDSLFSVVCVDE